MFLTLILITVFLLGAIVINSIRRPKNFPPGPPWLPIIGNIPEVKRLSNALGGQYKALSALSKQYKTNILGLKLGNELVVTVFSYPLVRMTLKDDVYEGRPDNFFVKLRSMGTRKGITCTDGNLWTIQRSFLIQHLRNLGYGKQAMETMIQEELAEVLEIIKQAGPEIEIGSLLPPSVINVLWALTAGTRIPRNDQRLNKLLQLLQERTRVFDMSGGLLSQHPWLRFIAPEKTGYNLMMRLNNELKKFFMETIAEHHRNWSKDKDDDIIYSFISKMKKENSTDSTFTDDQLIMICLDIFIAGSQTTSYTLDFAFLAMLLHPDVQKKVQKELDDAVGNKVLVYSDRQKLPYLEAVLLEIERYHHVAPIIGPRRVLHDTQLGGYFIPKNTTVLISTYSVHMDRDFWGDPDVFRPERFLNENGQIVIPDRLIPFGLGRRRCLGESLARTCIFLFFAGILREYSILPDPDKSMPTGVPVPGITLAPEKYTAKFIKRN